MSTSFFDAPCDRAGTGSMKWEKFRDRDVLPMWVADMDFRSPPAVTKALEARARHGMFGYTIPPDDVVDSVLVYLQAFHGWEVEAEELVFLPGLVPALNLCCRAYAQPGEGVITATPVYPPFLTAPEQQRRLTQAVPLAREDNGHWHFDWPAMEAAVTSETRMFMLCSPHNPVGRAFTREELEEVVAFCVRHNLVLISDEIHSDLILEPDRKHVITAMLSAEARERTVTLMAPSKTYNLAGLACAFAVIPDRKLRLAFQRTARGIITEVNCFGYTACAAAYRAGEAWRHELLAYLRGNRDRLYAHAAAHWPEIVIDPMEATYLAWLDVRPLELDDPAGFFEAHGVGLSDGRFFGSKGWVRLNFGCPREQLDEALERMDAALAAWRAEREK